MGGSQKVFLRIVGLIGDSGDPDEMPDRVNVTGSGRLIPTIAVGAADVAQGPDSLHEIRLIEPVPFDIVDGMLTYDAKPYVWLPVPTGEWMWRITFDQVRVGEHLRELRDFMFPLDAATEAQIADPGYPGVNLAQYGIGAWEPGTVNLTAQAISQITIYLGRASNAAGDAEQSRAAAQQLVTDHTAHTAQVTADLAQTISTFETQLDATHDHIHLDVEHADTHAIAAGAASDIATTKASEASASAGVATTKASEAAQSRADALTFRNTAQGAATTATTKAGEASVSAQTATDKAAQTAIDALTLAQRVSTGAREIKRTSDGKPYLIPEAQVTEVDLRVDTSVGTRVFLGNTMIYGDTGWRDVTGMLVNGWTARYVHIRRIADMAYINVTAMVGGSLPDFLPVIEGFYRYPSGSTSQTALPGGTTFTVGGNTGGFYSTTGTGLQYFNAWWPTYQTWPSSLPGIPGNIS